MIIPVILAGGSGTRLWPLSRELYPKQLLPLAGPETMLQATMQRVAQLAGAGPAIVVCTEAHRFMVAEQLRAINLTATILIEPVGRDTAPAIAAAALEALVSGHGAPHLAAIGPAHGQEHASPSRLPQPAAPRDRLLQGESGDQLPADDSEPVLLVLPADHLITDVPAFAAAVRGGLAQAEAGRLVTFGIIPDRAETGYGYIKKGAALADADNAFAVAAFVEKPDPATAEQYVGEGYLWNSGMFLFKASAFLTELAAFEPEMTAAVHQAHEERRRDLDFIRLAEEPFAASPARSVDYAVMERTGQAAVVPLACGWNDIGSWQALWEIGSPNEDGNIFQGRVLNRGSRNCYVNASSRLVALVGVHDQVVVETADAILVAHRDRVQEVKEIVGELKKQGGQEALLHRRVFRPWGSYECVDSSERFQVKRITVNPGASLSLQRHYHRAEHWVVVKGSAEVLNGEAILLLGENESTFIPVGARHRLRNPGHIPLELIEVQSGSYLGEDDIERFDDDYGR